MIKFKPPGRVRRPSRSKVQFITAIIRNDIHEYITNRCSIQNIHSLDLVGEMIEDSFATMVAEELVELGLDPKKLRNDELRDFYRGIVPPMDAEELADRSGLSLADVLTLAKDGHIKKEPPCSIGPKPEFDRRWAMEWARSDEPGRLVKEYC